MKFKNIQCLTKKNKRLSFKVIQLHYFFVSNQIKLIKNWNKNKEIKPFVELHLVITAPFLFRQNAHIFSYKKTPLM